MRIFRYLAMLVIVAPLLALLPSQAMAQTWKPLCVNGGNTAGAHNSTWQKINTPSVGGSTWKQAGGCIAPPPPTCANGASNYPTCTFPNPIDLSGIPTSLWSAQTNNGSQTGFVFGHNGIWQTGESRSDDRSIVNTRSGSFLLYGANPSDFEIYIHVVTWKTSAWGQFGTIYDDGYRDKWINIGSGAYGNDVYQFIDDTELYTGPDGLTFPGGTSYKVTYSITIRKISDPSINASMTMTMAIGPLAQYY